MGLELVVGQLYSYKELQDADFYLVRYWSQRSIYTLDNITGHYFSHLPFKRLKMHFKYEYSFPLPGENEDEIFTEYDTEEIEEELKNCCGPERFGC